jgi:hypothetical protein
MNLIYRKQTRLVFTSSRETGIQAAVKPLFLRLLNQYWFNHNLRLERYTRTPAGRRPAACSFAHCQLYFDSARHLSNGALHECPFERAIAPLTCDYEIFPLILEPFILYRELAGMFVCQHEPSFLAATNVR